MSRPTIRIITVMFVMCAVWIGMGILWSAGSVPPLTVSGNIPSPLTPPPSLPPPDIKKRQEEEKKAEPSSFPVSSLPPIERTKSCFHTNTPVQVTDDRGYVCSPFDTLDSKCCNLVKPYVRRYVCDNCTVSGCCPSLEICVSCCMGQELKSVPDRRRYQQCTSSCRTSHESLGSNQHYMDTETHHCFQRRPPKINKQPAQQERSEIEWMTLD